MKKKELRSEPTEEEIAQKAEVIHRNSIHLLVVMKNYCKLNNTSAAELLNISCKDLKKYENYKRDLLQHNYCKFIGIYYLYAHENKLPFPPEIETICHFFIEKW